MLDTLSSLIVDHRRLVALLMAVLTVACALLIPRVTVNADQTRYLPTDSPMRAGMTAMEEEWGAQDEEATIRVMATGPATEADRASMADTLAAIDGVVDVDLTEDAAHVTQADGATASLYTLTVDGGYTSQAYTDVEDALTGMEPSGIQWASDNPSNVEQIPTWILACALGITLVILLLMCSSWVEPFLFLLTIGVAVVVNKGTNAIQGEISEVSSSIGAILQMVLSMDYSIILANRFRQERDAQRAAGDADAPGATAAAMRRALTGGFAAVSSASLTTFVGLIMLTLMSFRIGADLGIVLAKGVVISLVCVLTLLPALLVWSDRLITRTAKPFLEPDLSGLARAEHRGRRVLAAVFVVLLVGAGALQTRTTTAYTLERPDAVAEVFPKDNQVVVVYGTDDAEGAATLARAVEDGQVGGTTPRSVDAYATTVGRQRTVQEMTDALAEAQQGAEGAESTEGTGGTEAEGSPLLDETTLAVLYDDYHRDDTGTMTLTDLLTLLASTQASQDGGTGGPTSLPLSAQDQQALAGLGSLQAAAASGALDPAVLTTPMTPAQMATTLTGLSQQAALAQAVAAGADPAAAAQAAASVTGPSEDTLSLLYLYHDATTHTDPTWTMSVEELLHHVTGSVLTDPRLSQLITQEQRDQVTEAASQVEEARGLLVGETWGRVVVTTDLPEESAQTEAFVTALQEQADALLPGAHYLVGSSVMVHEMSDGFPAENLRITLLTAAAIFLIVAITFRSLVVPALLVLLVQCGVFITVTASGALVGSMYYLAMLVVQCILMGATIDYAIVLTTYYREHRRTKTVAEALRGAYDGSIHTILTSGLIMILATGVLGWLFENPTIGQICRTISIGALSAVLLIVLVLPALLSLLDRWVVPSRDRYDGAPLA